VKNVVYFDLETQKSAEEVGGWSNIQAMRMSVAVTYSTRRGDYRIYDERQVNELIEELRRADLVVGFNQLHFDYEVLAGINPFFNPEQVLTLDLMLDLQRELPHRLSLDAVAGATLGVEKTSDGMQAIRWYREGKLLPIAEYCCFDVKLTRLVHEYGIRHRQVYYFNRFRQKLSIGVDWR
jgi:DEAD/DEAH box helicase domain-containing protein